MHQSALSYPRLCGLLADRPTRLSQAMHNAGYLALGIPFSYVAFDTCDTEEGVRAMRSLGIRGLSLTIPHKEAAVPFMDSLSEDAQSIKSINTVVNTGSRLTGYNTDWTGIVNSFQEAAIDVKGASALILGAGGASRGVLYALNHMGIGRCMVFNRSLNRAEALAAEWGGAVVTALTEETVLAADVIVNATALGSSLAAGEMGFLETVFNAVSEKHVIFDLVTRDTGLLKESRARGARTVSGVRMLLFQALHQFELFTEVGAPRDAMESALYKELGS